MATSVKRLTRLGHTWGSVIVLVILSSCLSAGAETTVFSDNFARSERSDNPWGGVDESGRIKVLSGHQLAVDDNGEIRPCPFGPSVAVGDLNGDGLLDLVIADSVGFFWYYQNCGTANAPKFAVPELMPLWFGDPCPEFWNQEGLVTTNVVPRIQLVDYNHDGKLDLVVGNFPGKLFYLRNEGSRMVPAFRMPRNLDDITIPTRRQGKLWCNFLSPVVCDLLHDGHLGLLVGDGTYSANSIFYCLNKGSDDRPTFTEDYTKKIIPGMGREQLVPQIISWNGDGKADVLLAEREGYLNLFRNQGIDNQTGYPMFDNGQHVAIGDQERIEKCSTLTVANLSGGKLPDLVIGAPDGHVYLSKNVGDESNFKFGNLSALTAATSRSIILRPIGWSLAGGYGSDNDLLVCTSAQIEKGFVPPDAPGITYALRFFIDEATKPNLVFPSVLYPELDTRFVQRNAMVGLKAGARYKLTFWVKAADAISGLKYVFRGLQPTETSADPVIVQISDDVGASTAWNHYSATVRFESRSSDPKATVNLTFGWLFSGKGSLYVADVNLVKED